jgi:CBS domain containing-hemolysin-like protein
MGMLITFALISMVMSFLCSICESVILSTSFAHVEVLKKKGKKSGFILYDLKHEIDRPLAAILTLNTAANTLGASAVGAKINQIYGDEFVAIGSAILTLLILIASEIIPKILGAVYWKQLGNFVAYTIRFMIWITYPIVRISDLIADALQPGAGQQKKITREEMIMSAEIGESEGTLKRKETLIIKNLLRLDKIYVRDILTPRSVLVALPRHLTVKEVIEKFSPIPFSRIPTFESNLDTITGVVLRYKILESSSLNEDGLKLEDLAQPVHVIQESDSVSFCLDEFIKRREHLFIVTDGYGTTVGLVTLEDCIETLLGVEIVDEFDSVEDMRQFALEQWEKRKQERLAAAGKKFS